jgi:hypothetical protein
MGARRLAFDCGAMRVSDFHVVIRRLAWRNDDEDHAERDVK